MLTKTKLACGRDGNRISADTVRHATFINNTNRAFCVFHDQDQNRQHYDQVTTEEKPLYYQRFDTEILDKNPIVANLLEQAFDKLFPGKVGRLLDLGCGTAFYYPLLSRHAESILGRRCQQRNAAASKRNDRRARTAALPSVGMFRTGVAR